MSLSHINLLSIMKRCYSTKIEDGERTNIGDLMSQALGVNLTAVKILLIDIDSLSEVLLPVERSCCSLFCGTECNNEIYDFQQFLMIT